MRVDDEDFSFFLESAEFTEYFDGLTADEMIEELARLEDPATGGLFRTMNYYSSIYRRFVDLSCFDENLNDENRSDFIRIAGDIREILEKIIIPRLKPEIGENLRKAMTATDDYISRFGFYPRAVDMILTGARKPTGPYERGVIGEVLA